MTYDYDPSSHKVREVYSSTGLEIIYDNGVVIQDGLGRPSSIEQKVKLGDPTDPLVTTESYLTTIQYFDKENRIVTTNPRGNDPNDHGDEILPGHKIDGLIA